MPKITFSDGLAITSAVLTVVLIVLDKAGKLKGPILVGLLGLAAVMLFPLAIGNEWVAGSPNTQIKFARGLLMFFSVGVVFAALALWILPYDATEANGSEQRARSGKAFIHFGESAGGAQGAELPMDLFEAGMELKAYAGGPDDTVASLKMPANGRVSLHVDVKDGAGHSIVVINDDEFTVSSAGLDRNFSEGAFEVVDKDGLVVFQLIRKAPAEIVVNGTFKMSNGAYFLAGPKGALETNGPRYDYAPKPLFKYPSWKYPGKYANGE